jgi:hypothetical protein
MARVETRYFHGRDAEHFGRWPGASRAEMPASFQVAAKIAAGFVEALDRIADTLFALLLPGERF